MTSRIYLLCLVVVLLCDIKVESKSFGRGGGSRGGGSRGGSSLGKGWGSSSSHKTTWGSGSSHSYPSSSSGLSGYGSSGSHKYPSSSSGLSGYGSSGSHGYPSSSSGLSGYGSSGSHKYPSSSSGLSGYGSSGSHGYPSSSSGLSGYGSSGSHSYPSSGSSLSGYGTSGNKYPSSSTGWSGSGYSGYKPSGSSYQPSSSVINYHPSNSYNTHNSHSPSGGYGSGFYGHGGSMSYIPNYYTAPQHIYIQQYRSSGSRFNDLLTGLTLYNLVRSNNHHHDHYYSDDYYRHRYYGQNSASSGNRPANKPQDEATCMLRIKENSSEKLLKIPCEIVSTFSADSKNSSIVQSKSTNSTVCVTKLVVANETNTATEPSTTVFTTTSTDSSTTSTTQEPLPSSVSDCTDNIPINYGDIKATIDEMMKCVNTQLGKTTKQDSEEEKITTQKQKIDTTTTSKPEVRMVNITECTTVTTTDPLKEKGATLNTDSMECSVIIRTKDSYLRNDVNCTTLMEYAKMPVPEKKESAIVPTRSKLKSWLDNPPWWLAMFIAV